jgi:predicted nuclease of predicted toxin-antitoxin system
VAKLYADEHFPRELTQLLRELGHDVLTVQEAGNADQRIPDEEVIAFAIEHQRAVITMNRRHFVRLHCELSSHCGVVVCTQDSDWAGQAKRIDRALKEYSTLDNELVRVYRPS